MYRGGYVYVYTCTASLTAGLDRYKGQSVIEWLLCVLTSYCSERCGQYRHCIMRALLGYQVAADNK